MGDAATAPAPSAIAALLGSAYDGLSYIRFGPATPQMTATPQDRAVAARQAWLRALERTAPIASAPSVTLPVLIERQAERFADAPALLDTQVHWSYRDLAARANRYARWAMAQGIRGGDVVCLMMENEADYFALWLGITRVGGVAALVNGNLAGDALAQSIAGVAPAHIVAGASLAHRVTGLGPQGAHCWAHGAGSHGLPRIDEEIARLPDDPLSSAERALPSIADRALYLYTSGTTGLPKPASVSHFRLMQWSLWFAGMMDAGPGDRIYDCLPMYHSMGGIVAIGAALAAGGSVAIRPRFSASGFWNDVVATDCTIFQYIGELCRYLVNAAPHPMETRHRLRLCCGNGLAADVWPDFQRRFRIPRILEFYAATEGVVSLFNCEGEAGAIGRVPGFLAHRSAVALVKFDPAAEAPVRDAAGRCIRCGVGEAGEAIGRLGGESGRFEGYRDADATQQKILRDVFAPGDRWFRTGDLMRQDEAGFFYFVDRIGDTFRWKGENVSAGEVAAAIRGVPGVEDGVVYGVRVPGADGRAGMAAIVAGPAFDLAVLWRELAARLPDYAQPLFLRIRPALDLTPTMRPQKQDLMRDGFDPAAVADPLYFNDRDARAFVPLDAALHRRIAEGAVRL
jgi:fatty-acyl-CoA synthase